MEDDNKVKKVINIITTVFVSLIILGLIGTFMFSVNRNKQTTKLNTYLLKNGYKKSENTYYKKTRKQVEDAVTITTYNYVTNKNVFLKEYTTNSTNYKEQATLTYNGTKELKIKYSYTQFSKTTSNKTIIQSGTYNYKTKKFKCKIETNSSLKTKCDQLLLQFKIFSNEIQTITKNSNINELFTAKGGEV